MRIILLLLFILLLPFGAKSQQVVTPKPVKGFLWFKINKYDKEGNMHGRWKVFFGKDNTVIRNGRFRHGHEAGTWKYYYPDGTRYMREKYSRNSEIIKVTKYHENGEIARRGEARLIKTSTLDKYFWFGEWEVYDENGNFSHIEVYKDGNLISRK